MQEFLNTLGEIVHNLQTERGYSLLFLTRADNKLKKNLLAQIDETNKQYQKIFNTAQNSLQYRSLNNIQQNMLKTTTNNLNELNIRRKRIMNVKNIVHSEVINYYSNDVILPIIYLLINLSLSLKDQHPSAINAYSFLLQWKERIGLERALFVSSGLSSYIFNSKVFIERIEFLLSEQENLKKHFLLLANKEQQKLVHSMYASSAVKTLSNIHQEIKNNKDSIILKNMKIDDWFSIVSEKINFLHKIEKEIVFNFSKHNEAANSSLTIAKNKLEIIYKLPIFFDLDKSYVNEIIKHGRIYQVPKRTNLFFEDSIPTYLHIILKGGVKIYKNSVDGNETILQLLSNHDSILEESIFIGSNFYASAQTTSDTELFSLPITIIDNSIKKHEISANITTIVSHKLQFLNNEIEYIKSKSVNQKIGFFLLQLFNKNNRVNKINLPYSKSLIANYLGISRESFSRSLNALDKNDFKIEKNIVTVINEHSLCRYCSGNISNNCPSYRKHQCSRR